MPGPCPLPGPWPRAGPWPKTGSLAGALAPADATAPEPAPGVRAATAEAPPAARWIVPGALGLTALAAGGGALALGLTAQRDTDDYRAQVRRTGLDDADARADIDRRQAWSTGLTIGAGVLAAAAIGSLFVDWGGPEVGAAPTQGGAAAAASWRW